MWHPNDPNAPEPCEWCLGDGCYDCLDPGAEPDTPPDDGAAIQYGGVDITDTGINDHH